MVIKFIADEGPRTRDGSDTVIEDDLGLARLRYGHMHGSEKMLSWASKDPMAHCVDATPSSFWYPYS